MIEGFGHFERITAASSKLLAVDRLPAIDGTNEERVGAAFLLTFEAGRLLVSAKPEAQRLHVLHLADKEDAPGGLVSAVEEEPWWRVLGSPLVRATNDDEGRRLRLQMRPDDDNPRFVLLGLFGGTVQAGLGK